jgi:ribosomal protein S18
MDSVEKVMTEEVNTENQNLNTETSTNAVVEASGTQQAVETKTFTQEELNKIIEERLKREREKYKDYSELKKIAEEYKKIKEAEMTEQEKMLQKLSEYERSLLDKEREAEELRIELLKIRILDEMGLPKAWAKRIFGTNEEEIRQDAEELKKILGTPKPSQIGAGSNPASAVGLTPDLEKLGKMSMEEYIKFRKSGG